MKKRLIFAVFALTYLISLAYLKNTTKAVSPSDQIAGGQCTYDELDGLCKVLNLYFNPEKASTKLVKFKFQPDINLSIASLELLKNNDMIDTDQERTLNEAVPADWNQHNKNQVEIGDTLSCKLKIEKSGTCTPIIFAFEDLQKNPSAFDDLALKQTIAEIIFLLIPIGIIIIIFIVKYEKFMHKFKKIRKIRKKKR
jgi:hypothetical protein